MNQRLSACDRCHQQRSAQYRAIIDRFLCPSCWTWARTLSVWDALQAIDHPELAPFDGSEA